MTCHLFVVMLLCLGSSQSERNIAIGKKASQSSTLVTRHIAAHAIDGSNKTISRTGGDVNSWWLVDLQSPERLSRIILHLADGDFWDLNVILSLSGAAWSNARAETINDKTIVYRVTSDTIYRYVKVQHLLPNKSIALREVEVYREILTSDEKSHLPFKPSFVSDWYEIRSQSSNYSEISINHDLNEVPAKVIADIKVKDDDEDIIFHGFGGAQCDDDFGNNYGGVLVLYDQRKVLLIAPKENNGNTRRGRVIYIGARESWEGPDIKRQYDKASVRIRVWRYSDFPKPSFSSPWYFVSTEIDQKHTIYREIEHSVKGYPSLVSLQVKIRLHKRTYWFEGQGSTSVLDVEKKWGSTSGAVYGFSNRSVRVWFPYGKNIRGRLQGYVFFASDGWGNENYKVRKGHYRVTVWKFEPTPLYKAKLTVLTLDFNVPIKFPFYSSLELMITNVQFEVREGIHAGFRFSGVGSSMHDGGFYGQYGGLIYGVTSTSVLLWVPNPWRLTSRRGRGHIFNIGGIWGDGAKQQKTNFVTLRIEIYGLFEKDDIICVADKNEFPYMDFNNMDITYTTELNSECPTGTKYRSGNDTRDCQRNGKWSGRPLDCQDIKCPSDKLDIDHTTHILTGLKVNDMVTYSCVYGYHLIHGYATRKCQSNGTWDGLPPFCEEITCPLFNVSNATYSSTGNKLDDVVIYMCNYGFRLLTGNSSRKCGQDGRWNGHVPVCQEIECPVEYLDIRNTSYNVTGFKLNDVLKYQCSYGFRHVIGNLTRICQTDGTWSGYTPICKEIECSIDRLQLYNASYRITGTKLDDIATHECDFGYRHADGNMTRTCQHDDTWSGQAPVCKVIECPIEFLNSSMTLLNITGNNYMDIATFKCPETHRYTGGDKHRICQLNSTWKGSPLKCKRCQCPCLIFNISNINIEQEMAQIKEVLTVKKQKLSSFVRKKTCAEDNRPTAKGLGISGALIIIACVLLVVIPELPLICRHTKIGVRNMSHRCKRRKSKTYTLVPLEDIVSSLPDAASVSSREISDTC